MRKKPGEHRYYACRGRVSRISRDGKRCKLPYVRADWLERGVWNKVKEVLNDSGKLVECINKSLIELEDKRKEICVGSMTIESKLKAVRAKEERLGMAFADGAVNETAYKTKLKRLKKEEADLLKCQRNIDLVELAEMISLGIRIDMVKDVLNKGSLLVTDSGIFGQIEEIFTTLDFNVSPEHEGVDNTYGLNVTDVAMRATEAPLNTREADDPGEKQEAIKRTRRDILKKFNIRVIVYPERVEIKGTIPTQILDKNNKEVTAPIITSPSFTKGGGSY